MKDDLQYIYDHIKGKHGMILTNPSPKQFDDLHYLKELKTLTLLYFNNQDVERKIPSRVAGNIKKLQVPDLQAPTFRLPILPSVITLPLFAFLQ